MTAHDYMPGDVYFISDGESIKIGYSGSALLRLDALQSSSSKRLTLLGTITGTMEDEKRLHRKFDAIRLHGEWFRATPELLAFIERGFVDEPVAQEVAKKPPSKASIKALDQAIEALHAWAKGRSSSDQREAKNVIEAMRLRRDMPDDDHAKLVLILATERMASVVEKRPTADWFWQTLKLGRILDGGKLHLPVPVPGMA